MAVRNFWISTQVDGRATASTAGPTAKDGGFETIIKMRDQGQPKEALRVQGFAEEDGTLRLYVKFPGDPDPIEITTKR